ncbi:MAG TPA: hypothetical protein VI454_05170 [Verrucomicrobiae bacterium]
MQDDDLQLQDGNLQLQDAELQSPKRVRVSTSGTFKARVVMFLLLAARRGRWKRMVEKCFPTVEKSFSTSRVVPWVCRYRREEFGKCFRAKVRRPRLHECLGITGVLELLPQRPRRLTRAHPGVEWRKKIGLARQVFIAVTSVTITGRKKQK